MRKKNCNYSKEYVKAYIHEHFPYKEVIDAFEACFYDVDDFFTKKFNDAIQDQNLYISLLVDLKAELSSLWVDLANGYWMIDDTCDNLSDIYRAFWQAKTHYDVWAQLFKLPTTVACQLFHCYDGSAEIEGYYPVYSKNPDMASEMIKYLLYHIHD